MTAASTATGAFSDYRKQLDQLWMSTRHFIAGGGAGAISKTVVAPMERCKMLMQVEQLRGGKSSAVQTARRVYVEEGVLAFWKGNFVAVVRIIPNKGILFMTNDIFVKMLSEPGQPMSDGRRLIAGAMSGATLSTLTYPLDITQTRLTTTTGRFTGIWDCLSKTARLEGPLALYKGYLPSLLGVTPYVGLQFLTYEKLTKMWASRDGKISLTASLWAGAIAGSVGQTISYPLDTMRRRLQVQGALGQVVYTGLWDCTKKIFRQEGMGGFYRGVWLNALRAAPSQAVQFAAYGVLKQMMGL
jgi:solute carrier family 25 phosphate transporter 23/24/25/41